MNKDTEQLFRDIFQREGSTSLEMMEHYLFYRCGIHCLPRKDRDRVHIMGTFWSLINQEVLELDRQKLGRVKKGPNFEQRAVVV